MNVRVNVYNDKDRVCGPDAGYVAVASDMVAMCSKAPTIDEAILKFKEQYGSMMVFDFHVIM